MGFQDDFGDQAPDEATRTMVGRLRSPHDLEAANALIQQQRAYRQGVAPHPWRRGVDHAYSL